MKSLPKPALFLAFIAIMVCGQLLAEEKIQYTKKAFSRSAKIVMRLKENQYVYTVPLKNVSPTLKHTLPIQLNHLKLISTRLNPGKEVVKFFRYLSRANKGESFKGPLLQLLEELPLEKPHTYVVKKNRLIFTQTTANPKKEKAKDIYSKHYMLSLPSTKAFCAGEFHLLYDELDGQYILLFDNNSGTYRPSDKEMEKLKSVLEKNFLKKEVKDYVRIEVKNFEETFDEAKLRLLFTSHFSAA